MPASSQKTPNIRNLRLAPDQLKAAKKFASDLGIGRTDDLYYYALLWYKENVRADGDFLSPTKRKRYDKELEKKKNNKTYKGAIGREIIGQIVILSTQKIEEKDLLKDTDVNTAPTIQAATVRVRKKTTPIIPPKPKVTLTIDKEEVEKGESYTVTWKSENANFVSRSRGFTPQLKDVDLSGSQTLKAERLGSKTFYITVRNHKGSIAIASATIIIVQEKSIDSPGIGPTQQPPPGTATQQKPKTTRVAKQSTVLNDIQILKKIHNSLSNILGLLEKQSGINKSIEKTRKKEAETERRSKRESILESAKSAGGVLVEKALTPIKSIFEKIWRFIFFTLLGRAFTEFLNWFNDPKNKDKVKTLSRFLKDNFWLLIGGAALYFLTPFGGFINSLLIKLAGYSARLIATKVIFTPPVIAGALAGMLGYLGYKEQESFINRESEKRAKQEGRPVEDVKKDIQKVITPIWDTRSAPNAAFSSGGEIHEGLVTNRTGRRVTGAGIDTQLTALAPGEIVMNRSAVKAVGADNLLALNKMFGGANANKPKKLGNIIGMSGGGMVGGNSLINPQAKYIFDRLVKKGLTRTAAAGIVANIGVESAYSYHPNTHQLKGGPGRGLVQWEKGGRFDTDPINLTSFAKARKRKWNDMDTQIDFIMHELNTHPEYQLVKEKLNRATSVSQATDIFLRDYEKAGTPHVENRLRVANQIVQAGWLEPPKAKPQTKPQGIQLPGLSSIQSLFSSASRPASAESKPPQKPASASSKPKSKSKQKPWWDLSRFMGKKRGGSIGEGIHVKSNMFSVNGLTDDRFPTLLQAGEYVIPKLTVQKIGLQFFNDLVSTTDKNSEASKIKSFQKNESLIPSPPISANSSQVIKLPPIIKNNMAASSSPSGERSQIPPFPTVSPQASETRAFLAEIYKIA